MMRSTFLDKESYFDTEYMCLSKRKIEKGKMMTRVKPAIHYENTVQGLFVRRINRFVAEVQIDGNTEKVHVKNTGRLKELLVPEAKVTLQKTSNPNRKTAYDLISVYKPRLKWVNIDSLAPNELMKQQLFPDAPTERGVKHLDELAAAAGKGYFCEIAFVIQMNGIHMVFPNNDTQPEFGQVLARAANAGVQVVYYSCHVEADSIRITGTVSDTGRYASVPRRYC